MLQISSYLGDLNMYSFQYKMIEKVYNLQKNMIETFYYNNILI